MGMFSDGNIKILARRKFTQTAGGFSKHIVWLKKHDLGSESLLQVVLEATGVYHESLLFDLYEQGFGVCLILAKQGKDYARSLNQFSKNDTIDSEMLAHLAVHRQLDRWKPFSEHIYQIRSLMRHRRALVQERVVFKNRLHALNHAKIRSEAVISSTELIIGTFDTQIREAEKQAESLAKADLNLWEKIQQIVSSLFGVGMITILEIIAETNGFEAFSSVSQLIRYAGYDIVENQSGKHTGKTKISKKGNARLRAAMYMPALSLIRHKVEPFYNLFERVLKRSGFHHKKAQVAVQRKLLILIYTLWKSGEKFDPDRYKQASQQNQESLQNIPQKESKPTFENGKEQPAQKQNQLHTFDPRKGSSSDGSPELRGIVSTKVHASYLDANLTKI